jgi:hypothetical protein
MVPVTVANAVSAVSGVEPLEELSLAVAIPFSSWIAIGAWRRAKPRTG